MIGTAADDARARPREASPIVRPWAAVTVTLLVAGSIGVSAFLLFVLELLVGRLVLPAFGGAPAAWAGVLVFFQAVLLVGYLYGHIVVSRLPVVAGLAVHAVVVAAALASLMAWPDRLSTLRDPTLAPVFDVLRVLTVALGLPAFLLTTTTPLLSAWYSRLRGSREADDPFWLYAVSNGASFAALVTYPLVIEQVWGLAAQRAAWMAGFVLLAATLLAIAAVVAVGGRVRAADGRGRAVPADDALVSVRAVTPRRRLAWIIVAAVPSALLSAVSNLITTDLLAAPMLWMLPLAIYLLSFVVAFSPRMERVVPWALALTPVAVTLLWVPLGSAWLWPAAGLTVLVLGAYAVVATGLNGVLALDRPGARHLTDFYLCLALGGVMGGAFVGVVAPMVFPNLWEYPILLVMSLVAIAWAVPAGRIPDAPAVRMPWARPRIIDPATQTRVGTTVRRLGALRPFVAGAPERLVPYALVGGFVLLLLVPRGGFAADSVLRWLLVGGVLLVVGGVARVFVAATAVLLVIVTLVLPGPATFEARSFFGVSRVVDEGGAFRILMNGTTLHGVQATDPPLRRAPTSYYVEDGPAGDFFAVARSRASDGRVDAGIAGLGTGVLATYERSGDAFTYYEIDPVVIRIASDPSLFTFLADAPDRPRIVEGDARLSLAEVASSTHDLLVIDAFSSDSPPAHLLTTEAIADAMRTVRPGGLLVLHVSNRYYSLAPAVAGAAAALGLSAVERDYQPTQDDIARLHAFPSSWVALARGPSDLDPLRARGWVSPGTTEPLTDDRPDLLRLMRPPW